MQSCHTISLVSLPNCAHPDVLAITLYQTVTKWGPVQFFVCVPSLNISTEHMPRPCHEPISLMTFTCNSHQMKHVPALVGFVHAAVYQVWLYHLLQQEYMGTVYDLFSFVKTFDYESFYPIMSACNYFQLRVCFNPNPGTWVLFGPVCDACISIHLVW